MKVTKNYVYGVRGTPDITESVDEAIYRAHRYRNRLCELEREKRDRHEALLRRLAPQYVAACDEVDRLQSELGDVREQIQRERQSQRTKLPKNVTSLTARAGELKALLSKARAARKSAKQRAYTDASVQAAMQDNQEQHKHAVKEAKATSGLYWGTEAVVRTSCRSFASGAPPRFRRYDGTGQLAVQLQGGLDTGQFDQPNTLCYLDGDDYCYIRIGSDGRRPVFARVRIVLHRPLPAGAIKWAYLERRKMANRNVYRIRLTVDTEAATADRASDTWVAVHYGWRREAGALRVALWQGSDGKRGSVTLQEDHLADYDDLAAIRRRRDIALNMTKERLAAWKADRELPEWIAAELSHVHQWRSPQRLSMLVSKWRDNRFDEDSEMFTIMDARRKADKHLWQHEARLSARVARRRNDIYRNLSADLGSRYGVLFHANIDVKELTGNSQPEELLADNTAAHKAARIAAVSTLRQFLCEQFPLHAIDVGSKDVTRQCHNCGELCSVSQQHRTVQCTSCRSWDVDENALANTIARGEAALKSGALLELSRQQRDREASQADRLLKMQAANRGARKRRVASQNNRV